MDQRQYSTLIDVLAAIPDPRNRRGQRHNWHTLLTIIVAGLASGYRSAQAIAHWAQLQREQWHMLLPQIARIPSESTVRRTLWQVDVASLEQGLAALTQAQQAAAPSLAGCVISPHGEVLQGQAVDGKALRGASTHADRTHLVSLVQHGSAATLAQTEVAHKRNEISAVPLLLDGRDLSGTVTTMDALLTQRKLAQQIIEQGGHYLMIVKRNQGRLYEDLELFFRLPPLPADQEIWDRVEQSSKSHGRLETRTLECSTGLVEYVTWPGGAQVMRRTCERVMIKTGKQSTEVSYGITSLGPEEARARQLEALWRGHWTIENRKHYVRDVTMGEDANQMHTGSAPQVLAALRNGLIDLWRQQGWHSIAEAIRACNASLHRTLVLIGALPARL